MWWRQLLVYLLPFLKLELRKVIKQVETPMLVKKKKQKMLTF